MAITTNQKPTIYRNLYENTGPGPPALAAIGQQLSDQLRHVYNVSQSHQQRIDNNQSPCTARRNRIVSGHSAAGRWSCRLCGRSGTRYFHLHASLTVFLQSLLAIPPRSAGMSNPFRPASQNKTRFICVRHLFFPTCRRYLAMQLPDSGPALARIWPATFGPAPGRSIASIL